MYCSKYLKLCQVQYIVGTDIIIQFFNLNEFVCLLNTLRTHMKYIYFFFAK